MDMDLAEVASAVGAATPAGAGRLVTSYHTDSREVRPGGLFFALRGASTDGHGFVPAAVAAGAAAIVVERPVDAGASAQVIVEDAWKALYDLARHVQDRVSPLTVAVTGSNGKTSTKEMAAAVLGARHRVHRTAGNLNTETGVPLTLLALEPGHTALVLEMGMQGPGEIDRLARLARPSAGAVTSIGSVHLEYFESVEGIARAKGELLAALPERGLALVPGDSEWAPLLAELAAAPVRTFGFGDACDLRAVGYRPEGSGSRFEAAGVEVRLGLGGRHMASNALVALALGEFAGVPVAEGARELAGVRVGQRLAEVRARGGYTIVDDSYNASPESMLAAFEALAERPREGRLLALLGEMRELGPAGPARHREVGERARGIFDAVGVVDVGLGAELAAAAGAELLPVERAASWVDACARPGDTVLVKASHGVHLEEVVAALAPERSP